MIHKCLIILLSVLSSFGATYYIDYVGGSDSNNGTTTGTAWKHAPAMAPFSGSYTHSAGDRFIFKGGVTWPNAALPLSVTTGGTEGNEDYFGVDAAWFTGGAWARPIFDGGGVVFTNHSGNRGNVFWLKSGSAHTTIDSIEITNWVFNNPITTSNSDGNCVYLDTTSDILLTNLYAHDWVVQSTSDPKFGGPISFSTTDERAYNCIISAPATVAAEYVTDTGGGLTSGTGILGFDVVDGCTFIGTTQGVWGCRIVRNCLIRDGQNSFSAAEHENGFWIQNSAYFYNNRIINAKEGVGGYFLTGWGSVNGARMVVFNNFFSTSARIWIAPDQNPSGNTNEMWFFNNVVTGQGLNVGSTQGGSPWGKLVVQNNILVGSNPYVIVDSNDLGNNYTNSHNVILSSAQASSDGFSTNNFYRPTLPVSGIYDSGFDLTGAFALDPDVPSISTDFDGDARTTWDVGAYEYVDSAPTISAISNQSMSKNGELVVPFSVSDDLDAAGDLTASRSSSNTTLLPLANCLLFGTGADCTLTLTPAANETGTSLITLGVVDSGGLTNYTTFTVSVNEVPYAAVTGGGGLARGRR